MGFGSLFSVLASDTSVRGQHTERDPPPPHPTQSGKLIHRAPLPASPTPDPAWREIKQSQSRV